MLMGMYNACHVLAFFSGRYMETLTYKCGLLRCSFRQGWAMRDAKTVGRVTGTATHTFLYYVLSK